MVAQSQKMALGNGVSAHGLVIWSSKMRLSPMGYAPLSARHDDPSAGHRAGESLRTSARTLRNKHSN